MDLSLVFWMIVAGVIGYQLYTALGREDGHESEERPSRPIPRPHLVHSADTNMDLAADPNAPAWLATIQDAYPGFVPDEFLDGATSAYESIVTGFSKGNLTEMVAFIDANVLKAFESVIEARASAGQTSQVDFVGIDKAEITSATKSGTSILVTVDFASNQIRVLKDAEGNVIEGVANRIELVKDRWTFSRNITSRDPNWTLVATGGASPGRKPS